MPKGIYTRTETHCLNISKAHKKRGAWKTIVSYTYLHKWIRAKKGKASQFKCVFNDSSCSKKIEWSNISHKYQRDINDFQPLCKSHHVKYDIKNKKVI